MAGRNAGELHDYVGKLPKPAKKKPDNRIPT